MMYKNPLVRHTFLFGALVGAMFIVAALAFYFKDQSLNYSPNLLMINNLLMISGIYLSIRKYRDEVLMGMIAYKRAFTTGLLTIAFASVFYALFTYIWCNYVDREVMTETISYFEKGMQKSGYAEKDIELLMSIYKQITPGIYALGQFFNKVFGGLFFSLLIAFFFRTNRNLRNQ